MRVKSFDSTRVFCWRASNLEVCNNNMECGILLLLLTHLLLVRAADDAVDSTQVKAGNVSAVINECYWSGEGPICDGKCRAGETVVSESKKNDGNGCIIGKKMYCCKGGAVLSSNNGTEPVAHLHHVKRQHVIEVTNSSSTQEQFLLVGDTKDDCYWVGKSPNCKGSCLEGDYMVNTSRTANGSTCIVGKKKYCCKGSGTNNTSNDVHSTHSGSSTTEAAPVKQMTNGNSSSCYWVGKAPICLGSCRFGDYVADKSPTGDGGGKCESGQKKFCCARQQSTAPVSTEEPPPLLKTTTGSSIGQMDNVNNSISNWTSARPFQARRRPTPRGLPINSTVTNRVKIVKIKRKLVMSTPTVANVSTSISMTSSETWSTLAMAQSLSTLPSTTESTTNASTTATATTESTTTVTTTPSTTTPTTTPTTTASTVTTTPSTTTASTTATTTTESTTTASTTTTTATTPSTTIASTTESTTPTTAATTTTSTATTTPSTTTASTTATTTTTIEFTTASTTMASTTESTTPTTATTTTTTSSTPIQSTTLAARSTSTATESTSLATGPSTPASSTSTSIKKPTPAIAPKKFTPFFDLPDVLPVPLIFRIQKSADTDIATTSIIQSSTTSTTTPTTLE